MHFQTKLIGGVALVVALIGAWLLFGIDWEARAIRKQFTELVELVEKDGPVSSIEALGRGRKLGQLFTDGARVEYYPGRELPRNLNAMGAALASVWSRVDRASVRIGRHAVEVAQSKESATSNLRLTCSVILEGAERMGDTIDYRAYWVRTDGKWLIDRFVTTGAER